MNPASSAEEKRDLLAPSDFLSARCRQETAEEHRPALIAARALEIALQTPALVVEFLGKLVLDDKPVSDKAISKALYLRRTDMPVNPHYLIALWSTASGVQQAAPLRTEIFASFEQIMAVDIARLEPLAEQQLDEEAAEARESAAIDAHIRATED